MSEKICLNRFNEKSVYRYEFEKIRERYYTENNTRADEGLNRILLSEKKSSSSEERNFSYDNTLATVFREMDRAFGNNIKFNQDLIPSGMNCFGDESCLKTALENLIINGLEALPETGGELTIQAFPVYSLRSSEKYRRLPLPQGNYFCIRIGDNGSGITPDKKELIFDPSYTTKENHAGIGLNTVLSTVKNLSGLIQIETIPGEGSTFTLYLPDYPEENNNSDSHSQSYNEENRYIMIIDDELMICEMIADMLSNMPYRTISFQDGREAAKFYEENHSRIDIIILDMIMPAIGGKETFYLLKEINPDLKVLISSGYSKNNDAESILKEGALEYLQKPYSFHNLQDAISRHLELPNKSI